MCPTLMLVGIDPPYLYGMSFVGLSFVSPPLLALILRTFVVLRTIEDPSHDVSLVRIRLRNRWEVTGVVRAL